MPEQKHQLLLSLKNAGKAWFSLTRKEKITIMLIGTIFAIGTIARLYL
jgi:hypothetical protein